MATPEAGRQLRQQRADIDSLYELVSAVDQKLSNLTSDVADVRREMATGLTDVRQEITDVRGDMTTGFADVHSTLAQILERLDR